jgi:hypothetical protein
MKEKERQARRPARLEYAQFTNSAGAKRPPHLNPLLAGTFRLKTESISLRLNLRAQGARGLTVNEELPPARARKLTVSEVRSYLTGSQILQEFGGVFEDDFSAGFL